MIGIIFEYAGEIIEVRLDGERIFLRTSTFGSQFTDINGLQFSYTGVVKEFPDLLGSEDWKQKAIERFKLKIASLPGELARAEYIAKDLSKYGYIPKYIQRQGFRAMRYRG